MLFHVFAVALLHPTWRHTMSGAARTAASTHLTLRFDGSFSGCCGGAGAVLCCEQRGLIWEGARFLRYGLASSAAAEYEGLILGLHAASAHRPGALHVEGDCRVVLGQVEGRSRSRKLSKLHTRASHLIAALPTRPTFGLVPREQNWHADALSRAAVEASTALLAQSIVCSAASGRRALALDLLERARLDGVPRSPALFESLLTLCDAAGDWRSLLEVYAQTQVCAPARTSEHALRLAIGAHMAIGTRADGAAGRQLAGLRRKLDALERPQRRSRASSAASAPIDASSLRRAEAAKQRAEAARLSNEARQAAASRWWEALRQSGGLGDQASAAACGVAHCDAIDVQHLLALADTLASTDGFGVSCEILDDVMDDV